MILGRVYAVSYYSETFLIARCGLAGLTSLKVKWSATGGSGMASGDCLLSIIATGGLGDKLSCSSAPPTFIFPFAFNDVFLVVCVLTRDRLAKRSSVEAEAVHNRPSTSASLQRFLAVLFAEI